MRRVVVLWLAMLVGCQADEPGPVFCTTELRTRSVEVVDSSGQPVNGLTTRTIHVPTGAELVRFAGIPSQNGPGIYILIDDSNAELADADGELFRFEITSTPTLISKDFVVTADECHHVMSGLAGQITLP